MTQQNQGLSAGNLSVLELFQLLWDGRRILSIFVVVAAISAVVYSVRQPNVYEAQTLLVSTDESGSSALRNIASQFGEIGRLTGSIFGQQKIGRSVIAMETLKSWDFAEMFLRKYNLEAVVWASIGWIEDSDEVIFDRSLYDSKTETWGEKNDGQSIAPTSWKLYRKYRESLSISQDDDTGLIRIGFEHHSPNISKRIVELLVIEINSRLQKADAINAEKNIKFLGEQMSTTANAEMQQVIARLIEDQMKTLMLSSGSREYVLKTVTAAKAPEDKKRPKRALICVFGTIAGFLIGVLVVLGRSYWPRRN